MIFLHRLLPLLLALLSAAPLSLAAQQDIQLEPGTRVRITLAREGRSIWSRAQVLQGTLTAESTDSLSLELDLGISPVSVAKASIARLEVSRGESSRWESAVWRAATYAGTGAAYWQLLDDDRSDDSDSWARGILLGSAAGAAVGAVLGALNPQEQWQRAKRGPETGDFTVPEPARIARIAVGGGLAAVGGDQLSGVGRHIQATVRLTPANRLFYARGELLYASADASGSPFACERVPDTYCFGRSDAHRQISAGVSVVGDAPFSWGPFQPYGIPLGIGVYHRSTRSSETQGPTTTCVIGGEVVSCPDNPPFETVRYTIDALGFGVNTGAGIRARVGDAQVFVELRAHTVLERKAFSGSVPVTFGLSF